MKLSAAAVVLLGILSSTCLWADELVLSKAELKARGYRPAREFQTLAAVNPEPDFKPHSLPWPVPFYDERHLIGNVMSQFQDYGGGAYYHGGDDLRVQERQWVSAPVTGRLEAGHYSYDTKPDGSNEKYWIPWPGEGNSMYFEVALITPAGYRFELHHIDRTTLTPEIRAALEKGGVTIAAGTRLGQVVVWPNSDTDDTIYHHTHYNIVAPDGTHLNPEYYSVPLGDTVAPVITAAYAVDSSGRAVELGNSTLRDRPRELVVVAYDQLAGNVYAHTPAYTRLVFDNGAQTTWDFRERLAGPDGRFPPIWSYFRDELSLGSGEVLRTRGDYDERRFLMRLSVPEGAKGHFKLEVGDSAGNVTAREGAID